MKPAPHILFKRDAAVRIGARASVFLIDFDEGAGETAGKADRVAIGHA